MESEIKNSFEMYAPNNVGTNEAQTTVNITRKLLTDLLEDKKLCIPSYQRGYSWRHHNVIELLESICHWFSSTPNLFHLVLETRLYSVGVVL